MFCIADLTASNERLINTHGILHDFAGLPGEVAAYRPFNSVAGDFARRTIDDLHLEFSVNRPCAGRGLLCVRLGDKLLDLHPAEWVIHEFRNSDVLERLPAGKHDDFAGGQRAIGDLLWRARPGTTRVKFTVSTPPSWLMRG